MKILGALVICLCLPGLAFAQHSGSFGSSSTSTPMSSGGGGGGAGGGEVSASMTHVPATQFHYPAARNDGSYVPSGFMPYSQAVSSAKPAPGVGSYLPFDKAVEEGREANEPPPSLGDFARAERARRHHKTPAN